MHNGGIWLSACMLMLGTNLTPTSEPGLVVCFHGNSLPPSAATCTICCGTGSTARRPWHTGAAFLFFFLFCFFLVCLPSVAVTGCRGFNSQTSDVWSQNAAVTQARRWFDVVWLCRCVNAKRLKFIKYILFRFFCFVHLQNLRNKVDFQVLSYCIRTVQGDES